MTVFLLCFFYHVYYFEDKIENVKQKSSRANGSLFYLFCLVHANTPLTDSGKAVL